MENIHCRLIDMMKDMYTSGRFQLAGPEKEIICQKTLLIITDIETCLEPRTQHLRTSTERRRSSEVRRSILLSPPPPKPPRSFSKDRLRKVSKLYAVEREASPNANLEMYAELIDKIYTQLIVILNLFQRIGQGEGTCYVPKTELEYWVDCVLRVMKLVETCKTVVSDSSGEEEGDVFEDDLLTPTPIEETGGADPLEIEINFPGYVDDMVDCSDQFDTETNGAHSQYERDERIYDSIDGMDGFGHVTLLNEPSETDDEPEEDSVITDYPEPIYSTVNKQDKVVPNDHEVNERNGCNTIDKEIAVSPYLDEITPVNSLVIEETVTIPKITQPEVPGQLTTECSQSNMSGYSGGSSNGSSAISISNATVENKIKWFTSLQESLKKKANLKKESLKKSVERLEVPAFRDSIRPGSVSANSGVDSSTSSRSPTVIRRPSFSKRLALDNSADKKERRQLKIRLKMMTKNLEDSARREEDALQDAEEWKTRFDSVYSQLIALNEQPVRVICSLLDHQINCSTR